ncbi:UbiA family prenyltransferase [Actinophytocola sp.]|uniref:UbiA family prenyltransferase n=1 Tax=Actinophytocola sp. TaxID=1872138 RepID=UPI003D6C0B2C
MTALETTRSTWRAYARLAKLDVFDYYLSAVLVWTLLAPAARLDDQTLGVLVVFGVGEVLLMAGLVALDDLTGYRDGSDLVNYGPDAPARRALRKPLLAGTLTEAQVVRFAVVTTVLGALLWTVAVVAAPHRPAWALVLTAVTLVLYPQYSWGLRLSYRGFQELYIAALGWALVLAPYGLLAGDVPGFVVVQALLFGLGPLLFGVYSNTNDIAGDRRVGRPTVAVLTTPRGNARFIAAVSLVELLLIAGAPLAGAPWWFPLAMLPTILLRANQYALCFRRRDILRARRLGIWIHRVTVVALLAVNLVGGH